MFAALLSDDQTAKERTGWQQVLEARADRSSFGIWWRHGDFITERGALDGLVHQVKIHTETMYDVEFWKQIESLFVLEMAIAEVPASTHKYVDDIVECIVGEVCD